MTCASVLAAGETLADLARKMGLSYGTLKAIVAYASEKRRAQRQARRLVHACWAFAQSARLLVLEDCTGVCTARARPGSGKHVRVVELAPVRENMRVGVGRHAELALADEPPDFRPRLALPVKQALPAPQPMYSYGRVPD